MSDDNEREALLWVPRPSNYTDPDIARGSREILLDLGSKTETPTGVAPPFPGSGKKRANTGNMSGEKKTKEIGGGSGGTFRKADHEMHIWTERERRKKMRNKFSSLYALLPHLPSKVDKSTIVDEAVSYIKCCQQTLQRLQKVKLERLHGITPTITNEQTLVSPGTLPADSREAFMADLVASNNATLSPSNTSKAMMTPRFNVPPSFHTFTSQNVVLNISGDQAFINICAPRRLGLFLTIYFIVEKHNLELMSCHVTSDLEKMSIMMQIQAKITPDQLPERFPVVEVYKQAAVEIVNEIDSYCYHI